MTPTTYKNILVSTIKYGPTFMALTCALKIHFSAHDDSTTSVQEIIVHILNLGLDAVLLFMFYAGGRFLNLCWKHRSLCRIAAWGYVYYPVILLSGIPHEEYHIISLYYVIFVAIVTLYYRFT